jgi:hypothetical protein
MTAVTFANFVLQNTKHLKGVTDDALITSELNRVFIDFVRSDNPLDAHMRQLIAGTLEECLFPPSPRRKRADRRWIEARFYKDLIKHVAADYKAQDISKPTAKAEEDVAKNYGLSVEAMKQRIKRAKRARSKKGQKL